MSLLHTPIRVRAVEFRNRAWVSPMCQYSSRDGAPTAWHLVHLGARATGGAGAVIVEASAVTPDGRISPEDSGVWCDRHVEAFRPIAAFVAEQGAVPGIQIAHAGRKASAQKPWDGAGPLPPGADPWPTIAASPLPWGEKWHTPREVTEDDMERVRQAFVSSAKRALRIGFDAIELHMAHGYLAHGFMSPVSNKRTDQYGGSLENRLRYPLSIARAVRAIVPKEVPLGARITGSDWRPDGLTPDDAVAIAKALKSEGIDFICISSGGVTADTRNPTEPGYNVPIAARVRKEAGVPTRTVGLILTPQQAEDILVQGKADQVSLARAFLDDPHWGWHAAKALGADVKRPVQYERAGPKLWAPAAAKA
jgi:2,4-dienoyl-CoA reductase-like NADH-dependent reductase (Old Yellow Enzyme family)